jgi:hypothetical protein
MRVARCRLLRGLLLDMTSVVGARDLGNDFGFGLMSSLRGFHSRGGRTSNSELEGDSRSFLSQL